MLAAAAVGAAWSAARGWLTPAVLFVLMNLVIVTIAVASRLMAPAAAPGDDEAAGERRSSLLVRAPSLAVDRLRASFSFSRLGLVADHHAQAHPLSFHDDPAPAEPSPQPAAGIGRQREAEEERERARVERSRSEAAAEAPATVRRRNRARRPRRTATAEDPPAPGAPADEARDAGAGAEGAAPAAVEVDERADDFIRRFREQLRLQRLDSLLRYRDALRRAGTA